MTAMLIVEPDWVLCVTSPFESTSCVPVQFPCEKQWSETRLVSVAPLAGVEICTDFCVCVAASPGLPICVPVPFRVGPFEKAASPGATIAERRWTNRSFWLEFWVESADTSDALYLRTLRTAAVTGRLELAIVLRHYGLVLAAGVRGQARTLLHRVALIGELVVEWAERWAGG